MQVTKTTATRKLGDAVYNIKVENNGHVSCGVKEILVDGKQVEKIERFSSGAHEVIVKMG